MRNLPKAEKANNDEKASLDVNILFGRITHLIDPEIRKMMARSFHGDENTTLNSGP